MLVICTLIYINFNFTIQLLFKLKNKWNIKLNLLIHDELRELKDNEANIWRLVDFQLRFLHFHCRQIISEPPTIHKIRLVHEVLEFLAVIDQFN